jgi:hypothetical protein
MERQRHFSALKEPSNWKRLKESQSVMSGMLLINMQRNKPLYVEITFTIIN